MSRIEQTLLGREREVELLEGVLSEAGEGVAGFVVVSGEAGIGKTRLLRELADIAVGRGCLTLEGSAAEFERELPFGLFTDALDAYLRSLDPRAVDRLAMDRLGELALVFPSLHGLDAVVEYPVSAAERFRVHYAVRDLIERLAAARPVVLVLDDLQWADGASLELIAYLSRRPPQAAVMVAMGLRTGQGDRATLKAIGGIQRTGVVQTIELGPLSLESVRQLLGDVDGVDVARLHHESGGNPFFALQLARSGGSQPGGPAAEALGVPLAVGRAIAAEMEGLSPAARAVTEAAAVVGDPFELDLVAATCGHSEMEVLERIDELVSGGMVRATEVPRRFRFRHPLVRTAVYSACAASTRVSCHRRAIDALTERGSSATVLATHVEQSARHGDTAGVDVLRRAGEDVANQAPSSAARWFASALRLLPADAPPAERVALLTALADANAATGRFADALASLEGSIELTPDADSELRGSLVVGCAEIEQLLGHHNESLARLRRAYDELADQRSPAAVSLLIALSAASLYLADHQGMLEWARLAVEAAGTVDDDAVLAAASAAHAMGAAFAGRIDLALELHDHAARLIDSLGDALLAPRIDALSCLSTAELYLDLYVESCRHGERGLSLARATGRTQLLPILTPILGTALTMTGEMTRSAEVLDDAIEAARLVGNTQAASLNLFNRALSALMAGDIGMALQLGTESVELARSVDNGVISAFAGAIHAQTLLEAGDPDAAFELLIESVGGEEIPLLAGSWRATFFELLTRCCLALGGRDRAEEAAQRVRLLADELGLCLSGLMADRAAAAVALEDGRPADAVELALSAIGQSERSGARVHAATSRRLAGRALAAAGRRDEAIDQLERAAAEFDALGALRYRDQVESELRQLGRTVHRRTSRGQEGGSGVATLTGRELEVAELVLARRTNRQIAEELFLSLKTVETHMRNIFHKLAVSSRLDVARTLARTRNATATT